jgi:hypothetical protein
MKYSFYFLTALVCMASISCQKGVDSPSPGSIDSLKAVLPKQIIYTDLTAPPAIATIAVAIKYDTNNRKIDLYIDDTANTNPYDLLEASYAYNSSGYLVSHKIFDELTGIPEEIYTINRSGDNKIVWMVYENKVSNHLDTTFFNYQPVSGGTKITTVLHSYYQASLFSIDTTLYTYSGDFKISQILASGGGRTTYEYNANNSLKKLTFLSPDESNETNMFYTSGITDDKEDFLLRALLGKDYYLQNIKEFYYFITYLDNEYILVSATDPYHPTRMQSVTKNNGLLFTDERTWSYELNAQKLVSKINSSFNAQQDIVLRFKY